MSSSSLIVPRPTLTIGGRVFTDLDNLVHLGGVTGADTNATFSKFDTFATAGYSPPANENFVILAVRVINLAGTNISISLGYADNDVGHDSGSAFTNAVFTLSGDTTARSTFAIDGVATEQQITDYATKIVIPANATSKFPMYQDSGGAVTTTVYAWGYANYSGG